MLLTLAALPLVFFMRPQSALAHAGAPHVMD
jgi:hypothetical protein